MTAPTFLERSSVAAPSRRKYRKEYDQFTAWAREHRHATTSIAQLDAALTAYMHERYFQGDIGSEASKMIAAVAFIRPDLRRGRPRSSA